jgi:tellurite resistance protein TerC
VLSWSTIVIIVQLIFLEGILSIDNAAVLGAMAAPLPTDQPIPWPRALHWLQEPSAQLLGMQREAALKVGLLGAYLGRFLMLLIATLIVRNVWLRVLGATYLIYLAVEHMAHLEAHTGDEQATGAATNHKRQVGFWSTVAVIELADLAFSLDNVVAAITLSHQLWVVMVGVGLGIIAMRFAATLFTRLIEWEPALQIGAYLLVFSLGVELLLKEFFHLHLAELAQFGISLGILAGTILIARSSLRTFSALWLPFLWLFKLLYTPFALVGRLLQLLLYPLRRATSV